jgi:hypothetical protein
MVFGGYTTLAMEQESVMIVGCVLLTFGKFLTNYGTK